MKHITIVYPEKQSALSTIACIVGTLEVFYNANIFWKKTEGKEPFKVQVAAVSANRYFPNGLVTLNIDTHFSDINKTDLIIIPSIDPAKSGFDQNLLDWIIKQYKNGAEIASMCSGAFLLAATGLMDGKSCSTHWALSDRFRKSFPKVDLQTDKLITDENGIYTNGGAYSFLNLIIYLVEKYFNRETAVYCCKVLQIEIDRNSQSVFSIFTGQKLHDDKIIQDAQQFIEENIEDKLSFVTMSTKFALSRRNFDRRFVKATGNTPLEYAQRVKIEVAKKALESSRKSINEIMYEVGYNDQKAFREVFRKITGLSPLEYKHRYNKQGAVK